MRHPKITTVTCPDTGAVYPIPAGGNGAGEGGSGDGGAGTGGEGDGAGNQGAGDGSGGGEGAGAGGGQGSPPWGSDEEFDPQRAWSLIQNLRHENAELKPQAAKARELEDAGKSELQRVTDQLEAARKDGGTAAAKLSRLEVALEKAPEGMSLDRVRKLADRLRGDTREQLEADAAELFAEFAGQEPANPGLDPRPRTVLRGGSDPDAPVEETDPRKLAERHARR